MRQIDDAWRRITSWLQHHAPDSYAALRAGASSSAITAVDHALHLQIPADLRAL
ncbi:hypothetical protein [Streptomyces sp. NPDC051310]|uniref:hypothetical protein n=1 Tax=Streptomyces sp. NPDC051310 TaxID=3365649 RepID=UPI0037A5D4D6